MSWHLGRMGYWISSQREIIGHSAWEATVGAFLTLPRGSKENKGNVRDKERKRVKEERKRKGLGGKSETLK